jgi:Phage integrase, N-terminal SAM-like domain
MPTTTPALSDYLAQWLADVIKPHDRPATYVLYEMIIRLYVSPGLGSKRLDRLTVRDVQTWVNELATTCQCCAQGKDAARPEEERQCCAIGKCLRKSSVAANSPGRPQCSSGSPESSDC